ncbi:MAG: DUF2785 domain-containing protein [Ktedonobacteraceae bacterium]|nr:DUF2785 domain-containing protein [Ktedonobacteraceae bacterium]
MRGCSTRLHLFLFKGWAHSAAHTADLLMVLANNRDLDAADLERILNAIAAKVQALVL